MGGGGLLALRLRTGNEAAWLSAAFADTPTALRMRADAVTTVPMTVRNTGLLDWPRLGDTPVHLSYHWVTPDGNEIFLWDGARTRLPDPVSVGDTVRLSAVIDANVPAGRYRLEWDLVQEQIAWFSTLGADTATTWVDVEHWDDAPVITELPAPIPHDRRERPSRLALWAAAFRMWAERPLIGIGPDQFRHRYGAHLHRQAFDDRTHSNSLYVETLVGQGVLGLLALVGLLATLVRAVARAWRHADLETRTLGVGLTLGIAAYAGHGVVDHFLSFTPTYGLFWLLIGLTVRLCSGEVTA